MAENSGSNINSTVSKPVAGLDKDTNVNNLKEGNYTFALNAVVEDTDGNGFVLSNEMSNKVYAYLKPDYILLGAIYIGDGETCIFSVSSDDMVSEIGIMSEKQSFENAEPGNNYKTWLNDADSLDEDKLHFKQTHQIQATYRLRRGCDKMVYWTDNLNVPRMVNLNTPDSYKNEQGKWVASMFSTQYFVNKSPKLKELKVLDNTGQLQPGSVSVFFQYLDVEKNATKFTSEIPNINIYKSNLNDYYTDISGSCNFDKIEGFNQGETSKAISIEWDDFDDNFEYYRLAFVMYNAFTGTPKECLITDIIPITQAKYVFTGTNIIEKLAIEEIKLFNNSLEIISSKTIAQKDNRLIFGNTQGTQLNIRDLQKYASRIAVDCAVKTMNLASVKDPHNPKNPLVNYNGMGFQPGEIYSLGIVYKFEDNTESPVFHIPGKSLKAGQKIYDKDFKDDKIKLYPMAVAPLQDPNSESDSYNRNYNKNQTYTKRTKCKGIDYWGLDVEGDPLLGQNVRHHRFPYRKDIKIPFVQTKSAEKDQDVYSNYVRLVQSKMDIASNRPSIYGTRDKEVEKELSESIEYINELTYTIKGDDTERVITTYYSNGDYQSNSSEVFEGEANLLKIKKLTTRVISASQSFSWSVSKNNGVEDYTKVSCHFLGGNTAVFNSWGKPNESGESERFTKEFRRGPANIGSKDSNGVYTVNDNFKSIVSKIRAKANKLVTDTASSENPLTYDQALTQVSEIVTVEGDNKVIYTMIDNEYGLTLDERQAVLKESTKTYSRSVSIFSAVNFGKLIFNEEGFKMYQITEDFWISKKDRVTITTKVSLYSTLGDLKTLYYKVPIMGLHFSNIQLPPEDVTGKKCVGYYIVKQNRTQDEKTILDSGYAFPTFSDKKAKFTGNGMLMPTYNTATYRHSKLNNKAVNIISPLYRFKGETFDSFSDIEEQITFVEDKSWYSGVLVQDVLDGSSASGVSKLAEFSKDEDGWTLKMPIKMTKIKQADKLRNNYLRIKNEKIKIYDLEPINQVDINDKEDKLYNLNAVNKNLFFVSNDEEGSTNNNLSVWKNLLSTNVPYVYIKRLKQDYYMDYLLASYNKVHTNTISEDNYTTFSGDCFIGAMREAYMCYANSAQAVRKKTASWLERWGGVIIGVVGGAALTLLTGGAAAGIVAGVLMAGGGIAYSIAGNIKMEAFNKAYNEDWNKGLRYVIYDRLFHRTFVRDADNDDRPLQPQDDSLYWLASGLGDMFFETSINLALRINFEGTGLEYLKPYKKFMENDRKKMWGGTGLQHVEWGRYSSSGLFGGSRPREYFWSDRYMEPKTGMESIQYEEKFFRDKIVVADKNRGKKENQGPGDRGFKYRNIPAPEMYTFNPDYGVTDRTLLSYPVPLEYNLCSDCNECFPQRFHWSDVSFQESLIDNYKIFKPNNYKDLNGEYGTITNIFVFNNELYIHTEEGLWHQPTNMQERVTDGVVSYIGTGEFGSIPARLIIDNRYGTSAGLQHREAALLTPNGYFFVSERERKIYQFNGQLNCISDKGMAKWFLENTELQVDHMYRKNNGRKYDFFDNPSNNFGTGFILTYDRELERVIVTKKDFGFSEEVTSKRGFELCVNSNNLKIFLDVKGTKDRMLDQGWIYECVEDCRIKFSKWVEKSKPVTTYVEEETYITNDTIVISYFDRTSMDSNDIDILRRTLEEWFPKFKASFNNGDNNITYIDSEKSFTNYKWGSEAWIREPAWKTLQEVGENKDVLLLVFVDESESDYHKDNLSVKNEPTNIYNKDLKAFLDMYPKFKSFKAINYPIIKGSYGINKAYMRHLIAAIEGRKLTDAELNKMKKSPVFTDSEWEDVKLFLKNNPYTTDLTRYGWMYKTDRMSGVGINFSEKCPPDQQYVITPCLFEEDIKNLLETRKEVRRIEKTTYVKSLEKEYTYVDGVLVEDDSAQQNSWTLSYGLRQQAWISFHSYTPNYYFYANNKHYSWRYGDKNIYQHNDRHTYQRFYNLGQDKPYPFIIEYVDNDNPIMTKVWEYIKIQTEAYKYVKDKNSHVNEHYTTFNKLIAYNTRQSTGVLNLIVKDTTHSGNDISIDYLQQQVQNGADYTPSEEGIDIIIDKNEKTWTINDLRDYVVDYSQPLFNEETLSKELQDYRIDKGYIDKLPNISIISKDKDWWDLQMLRDKYLVVRLIFDNFADVKLLFNFINENKNLSLR